jgi:glutamine amidotransferase
MNVILDYDSGNLDSVLRGFIDAKIETIISKDIEVIEEATSLVLPGVGAFGDAMDALKKSGLIPSILKHVEKGKYLFGICLGMQLLYEKGYEHGVYDGLGLIEGSVKYLDISKKVPHMGWNTLSFFQPNDPILTYIKENDYVYFVHSYYVDSSLKELISYTTYEKLIPAIVRKNNIYATQFHPEKSGQVGASILKAYKEILDDTDTSD